MYSVKATGEESGTWESHHWQERMAVFNQSSRQADIVMLGDSITEYADWDERFPDIRIANRGIAGDTTSGMLRRVTSVLSVHPKKVFVLAGINDLLGEHRKVEFILGNYSKLLSALVDGGPEVTVIATLPCNSMLVKDCRPDQVTALNSGLAKLAVGKIRFVDPTTALSDHGQLAERFTPDGIHLNNQGYGVVAGVLAPFMRLQVGPSQ